MANHAQAERASVTDPPASVSDEIMLASRAVAGGLLETDLLVPSARCGACIARIEGALSRLDRVVQARLNLSTRRVTVRWRRGERTPPFLEALAQAGYEASLSSCQTGDADPEMGRLVRATAVAGFAVMNIMLLSVSVWAGAGDQLRQVFHLLSALLAIPVVIYSGRIFFVSAWSALKSARTNMDVPITIGILLAFALSVYDTLQAEPHAYFDAVSSLIFFLLAGRTLDHMMRRKARTAVLGLTRLMPRGATVISSDGKRTYTRIEEIRTDQMLLVVAGDRIPLDGVVVAGEADVDAAIVNGYATPVRLAAGSPVLSGMLNLNGRLEVRVGRTVETSFIASMIRMMEAAEHGRAGYRRLADRAATLYAPVVHALAAVAFGGWIIATGDWHHSLTVAISVLIITCPCALGLAVPMVHVMAARRLFEKGIALKDGAALERLAQADMVVFDKTGTLTLGQLQVIACSVPPDEIEAAAALASLSGHPTSRAVAAVRKRVTPTVVEAFAEHPGLGIEGRVGGHLYRLGRPGWASRPDPGPDRAAAGDEPIGEGTVFSKDGIILGAFEFSDTLRAEARLAVSAVQARRLPVEILSGDREVNVSAVAASLGISRYRHGLTPEEKVCRLEQLRAAGRKVLMVGDGLNDAPALSAAHVSMAPASAADVGRAAADLVFLDAGLHAVSEALATAARARQLVRQNLVLAVVYNLLFVPVAMAGLVTPLIAAIAMSLSSILVVANSLRVSPGRPRAIPSPASVNVLVRPREVTP